MSTTLHLSKSKYCSAVQCPKMLWLFKNNPEAFDSSSIKQSVLDTGNEVGDLAMGLLGDFTEVPFDQDLSKMLATTDELLAQGTRVIAEASFAYDGLFCSVDILLNKGNKRVELYEVKSSTEVHNQYKDDVAYQTYVLRKLGFVVEKVCLVHINNQYVRHGELDIQELFAQEDLTEVAMQKQDEVETNLANLREYMKNPDEPEDPIGPHCFSPYECGFWAHCTESLPKPNVFDLSGIKKPTMFKHFNNGRVSFEDLQDEKGLSDKVKQQIRHELHDLPPEVDRQAVRAFLNTITFPLYFLDFESFSPAIPQYDDTWPYQQICFQYSLHYIEKDDPQNRLSTLKHAEFLAYPGADPRKALCEQLCRDIPLDACVMVFNKSFEPPRIKEMAALYPELSEHLLNIADHVVDLMEPFQQRKVYCRGMEGSYSIKNVLPALFPDDPELDYHNLEEVHNGTEASDLFARMATMSPEQLESSRKNLLKYCGLDTFATVKIWQKLHELADGE